MKTTQTRVNYCPVCLARLDAASNLEGQAQPHEGVVTVCLYCGSLLAFTDELSLEVCPDRVIEAMPLQTKIYVAKLIRLLGGSLPTGLQLPAVQLQLAHTFPISTPRKNRRR